MSLAAGFFLVVGLVVALPPAHAVTIPIANADLAQSTETSPDLLVEAIPVGGVSPASMPADGTFTQPFDGALAGGISTRWYRFDFTLPAGFTNVSLHMHLSIDNEIQLYLNDQTIAVEADTVTDTFNSPFPEFALNSNGTVSDISGTWNSLPITQSMFQVGNNELTFLAVNFGGPGAFSLVDSTNSETDHSRIEFDVQVPLPPSLGLMGLALTGLAVVSRLRRNR